MSEPRVVGKRYELRSLIKQGGMGSVWHALDLLLERDVAVKEIRLRNQIDVDMMAERFRREVRISARLDHSGIPKIYDAKFDTDANQMYLVMELVDGRPLDEIILDSRTLPAEWAIAVGAHLCGILSYVHGRSVVHRDIKPANVMIAYNGTVKLLDFGIALQTPTTDQRLTAPRSPMGTPGYMAPEQIYGTVVGPPADLYSVGMLIADMCGDLDPRLKLLLDQLRDMNPNKRPPDAHAVFQRLLTLLPTYAPGYRELPGPLPLTFPVAQPYRLAMAPATGMPQATKLLKVQTELTRLRRYRSEDDPLVVELRRHAGMLLAATHRFSEATEELFSVYHDMVTLYGDDAEEVVQVRDALARIRRHAPRH